MYNKVEGNITLSGNNLARGDSLLMDIKRYKYSLEKINL